MRTDVTRRVCVIYTGLPDKASTSSHCGTSSRLCASQNNARVDIEMAGTHSVAIRERVASDIPVLSQQLANAQPVTNYPVERALDLTSFLQPSDAFITWTALLDGRIVGHALINPPAEDSLPLVSLPNDDREPVSLGRLFVDLDAQGKGVGKALMDKAEEWARDNGKRLTLGVIDVHRDATKMYERRGWKKGGEKIYTIMGKPWRMLMYTSPV